MTGRSAEIQSYAKKSIKKRKSSQEISCICCIENTGNPEYVGEQKAGRRKNCFEHRKYRTTTGSHASWAPIKEPHVPDNRS